MASSSRSNATRARKPRKRRRTQYKKRLLQPKDKIRTPSDLPCSDFSTASSSDIDHVSKTDDSFGLESANGDDSLPPSGCCTPKAQRFRIPEIDTCPPAPKKQRVVSNCSLRRRHIAFFAPPDIELFFFFAHGEQVK